MNRKKLGERRAISVHCLWFRLRWIKKCQIHIRWAAQCITISFLDWWRVERWANSPMTEFSVNDKWKRATTLFLNSILDFIRGRSDQGHRFIIVWTNVQIMGYRAEETHAANMHNMKHKCIEWLDTCSRKATPSITNRKGIRYSFDDAKHMYPRLTAFRKSENFFPSFKLERSLRRSCHGMAPHLNDNIVPQFMQIQ